MSGEHEPNEYEQTQRRWPDPDDGPWMLLLFWERNDGRPEIAGLELKPVGRPTRPLTTSLLRDVRLAEIAAEERTKLPHVPPPPKETGEVLAGMRPATVRRLQAAARVYRDAWSQGENPTRAVAAKLNVSAGAAANLISRARQAGLLPPTSAGVPMG